jgi:glutamate dehydrogenase
MSQRLAGRNREQVDIIVKRARGVKLPEKLPFRRADLLQRYYADVAEEDLRDRDPKRLAAAALGHMSWALDRRPGMPKVRAFNPTLERDGWCCERTVVQLVNDDMPFLVDSVTLTLNRLGHGIQLTVHPRFRVRRTPQGRLEELITEAGEAGSVESYIHIEMIRETDPEVLQRLTAAIEETLRDVRLAVEDWQPMLTKVRAAREELAEHAPRLRGVLEESCALLDWLTDDNFTLLGYHEYRLSSGRKADSLRPIAGTGLGILRDARGSISQLISASPQTRRQVQSKVPLIITKAAARSTIHRAGHLDQIDIKVFDRSGKPEGERRLVGLFSSAAYNESPRDIPLVRLKLREVMRQSGLEAKSHRGKALQHILDTFPRDDLLQTSVADLARISTGILNLQERRQVRLFCRRNVYGEFFSCFVYLPRDQYNFRTRQRVEKVLAERFGATSIDTHLTISESILARLEATIRIPPGQNGLPDLAKLQKELEVTVQSWADQLRAALLERLDEDEALRLFHRFGECFPLAYQDEVDPIRGSADIRRVAALIDGHSALEMCLYRPPGAPGRRLHFTTCRLGEAIQLYTALPILEHMGMKVITEHLYKVRVDPDPVWIQDFELEVAHDFEIDPQSVEPRFLECFRRVLTGDAENDGFNSFVVTAELEWSEAALLRAYCKYLLQTAIKFSQSYMQEVLSAHPELCHALILYFHSLFDPDTKSAVRKSQLTASRETIAQNLDRVTNLDQDRILRAFLDAIDATLRTNYYQLHGNDRKPYISFKLNPQRLPDLPQPRPMFEIFVYSPRLEGAHLRGGRIARGGLRWSDRREDFRTEILGLMKAQQVKNTVIVPAGAKGGFVCKQLPSGDRKEIQAEGVACYRTFIRGLMDITDNILDGRIAAPERVLRRDGDDPYLVVAADKGTATFSDIANEIAAEYGFWLGDAFASGGSAGYDHKKMGITARGAWESVKRHFREIGIDTQSQTFTVVGIGDMGGDVFGNGMLLSPHIKLVAAFNHANIFIDPDPDPAVSYAERLRLFQLPRSSWEDYDASKLSDGGCVYSRQSKAIELTQPARRLLGLNKATITPPELIRATLCLDVDLLWNGGIGTYVKASQESHADAGDPANDAVRVDGSDLRCGVIGEGGNLGLTQRGRIEYALSGGRVNTDFIDNSGGVDSSDREVNIKILLNQAIATGKLRRSERDELLAEMTDEVADQVLLNNYAQTQALSMMCTGSRERLGEHARLIRNLESSGLLNRALEDLPSEDEIDERRQAGRGLTRPELAIILSYSKISLYSDLVQGDIPEDAFLAHELEAYFPERLRGRFAESILKHRLRREIIAMRIASSMINRMGPSFPMRTAEETGCTIADVARAYAIAREVFDIRSLWQSIEALDNRVQAEVQYDVMFQISRMLRRAVYWLLHRRTEGLGLAIEPSAMRLGPAARDLLVDLPALQSTSGQRRLRRDTEQLVELGVDETTAARIAALAAMNQTLDIVAMSEECKLPPREVAKLYFELNKGLKLDWIRENIEALRVEGRWRAMARATLRENVARQQRALLTAVLSQRGNRSPREALAEWLNDAKTEIARAHRTLAEMRAAGEMDFATISVAIKEIERLI